ncbi:MAG: trigger factor [Candidatus Gracilibacteria bacterium]|jgi:trigger factor|nr:trigger factor [Candidatus Gracilibacteria bacterium]
MKHTLKKLPKSEVELTIEVSKEALAKHRAQVIKEISLHKNIPGFRKGHVPEKILIEKVGETAIQGETIEMAINQSYIKAVKEEGIQVISAPKISIDKHDPLVYKAIVAIVPEAKVPELKDIKVPEKKTIKITKKEIDETKKMLAERMTELKKQDRAAKKDDLVECDFEGYDQDGVLLEDTKSKHHPIVIGSGAFVPGFEDQITGLKKDDEKDFEITFPKDYAKESFRNKKVKFHVKVHDVFERVIPKFDEKLIERLTGSKKTVEEMEQEIKESLKEKHENDQKQELEQKFLEELAKKSEVDIPEVLIEREIDNKIHSLQEFAMSRKIPWQKHLENMGKTEEDLRKEAAKDAEKAVKARICFQELMKKSAPKVEEKEIQTKIDAMITSAPKDQHAQARAQFQKGSESWHEVEWEMKITKFFDGLFK